jgi:S1-C subfamily serine protease
MYGKTLKVATILLALALLMLILAATNYLLTGNKGNWNDTVKQVSNGVVSIHIDVPISFDGKWNSSGFGTGFVVDAERGIILTNRHIVTPGPVTAKAIFINNEEVDLTPLYIDPVHDFGFYQYDPNQIKHLQPHQFRLSPKNPIVGQEIRIIGNDDGQKISILDGTIARTDRAAPLYGLGRYNDFNINYIQAATASTGGSSGSPVININGEVVALNAGGQAKSANAFYLPLAKIILALNTLQTNQNIERGTIKTTFLVKHYAELKRLGLNEKIEARYRQQFPDALGLLVVNAMIPESSASQVLEVGDILLSLNDQAIANFSSLESALNTQINNEVNLSVLRHGELVSLSVSVNDLDTITPSAYVKFDGGVFHNLSYQQARHFNKPIKGVYLANTSGGFAQAGIPDRSVITEFNGVSVDTVEEFDKQLSLIADGTKVNLRYYTLNTPNNSDYGLVEIDRTWFEHRYCRKDLDLGYWPCISSKLPINDHKIADKTAATKPDSVSTKPEDALVSINFTSPYSIQGRTGKNFASGTGVVVDSAQGLVVVPRTVVFSSLGDVKLIFDNREEISGKVEYLHPLHNLALVSYDPQLLAGIAVAQINISTKPVKQGQLIKQIGLNYDGEVEYRETEIDTIDELWLRQFKVPQFIDKNIDAISLVNPNVAIDGVLVNTADEVVALWTLFEESKGSNANTKLIGLSAEYVNELLALYYNKTPLYSLELNLTKIAPVDALQMGLPAEWLNKLAEQKPNTGKLLAVYNVAKSAPSAEIFKRGDIILAINDVPVSDFRQAELLSQSANVSVTYFSEGKLHTSEVNTAKLLGQDIDQVFYWSGLFLHSPHRAAQQQGNVGKEGVYVASYSYGSPATRYGVFAMQRIVAIDGKAIDTTVDFINAVKGKKHQSTVLIKTLDFQNNAKVITLRVDNHYWPFFEMKYSDGQWQKINYLAVQ